MISSTWCCNRRAVHHRLCSKPSWEWSCSSGKLTLNPSPWAMCPWEQAWNTKRQRTLLVQRAFCATIRQRNVCQNATLWILRGHIPGIARIVSSLWWWTRTAWAHAWTDWSNQVLTWPGWPFLLVLESRCRWVQAWRTRINRTRSSYIDRLILGVKMHSTAAFLSMPNRQGVITGGTTTRGFHDGWEKGYPLWLVLSTKQVSDVVRFDEEILRPKGGGHVKDDSAPVSRGPEEQRETMRQICAIRYLDGYSDTKVIDPIKENFLSCTMPLSCTTTPLTIAPAIMHNQKYATEYLAHASLIRELLEQSSLTTNPKLLASSGNRFLQSLSGLLTHSSNLPLTREPIPVWNLAQIRLCDRADAVYHQTLWQSRRDVSSNPRFGALRRHLHQYALCTHACVQASRKFRSPRPHLCDLCRGCTGTEIISESPFIFSDYVIFDFWSGCQEKARKEESKAPQGMRDVSGIFDVC